MRIELPILFKEQIKKLLCDKYENYLDAMTKPSYRGVRVNPLKVDSEKFYDNFQFITEKVPYENYGRVLLTNEKIGNSKEHMSGMIYLQEPSSMLPVASSNWNGREMVLDLCAAPGGKSTQIASYVRDGVIVSNEIVTNRAKILFSNIERLGVQNSIILNDTPKNISDNLYGFFDVVLVDAPCSGEGMFRKDPETINEWSVDGVKFNAIRQIEILNFADKCLKKGGKLIYSTCTFSEEEDENVVLKFMETHDYKLCEVREECKSWTQSGTSVKEARRFFPFTGKGEGQFVCVMEKQSDEDEFFVSKRASLNYIKGKELELIQKFLQDNFKITYEYKLIYIRNEIMLVKESMTKLLHANVNVINAGVRVGCIEKGIVKPHHQLFSALGIYAINKIKLNDDEFKQYIHGEELDIDHELNGYAALFIDGACIGGGKCVNGKLKNLFPKGLRI